MNGASPELSRLLAFICRRAGLVFPDVRAPDVREAVARANRRLGYTSIDDLHEHVRQDDAALEELVAELTIGETYFFRDRTQFEVLQSYVLPRLAARDARQPIRVWSAGCATGEEAYSLAMTLERAGLPQRASVLGTDISRARLRQAQRARYGRWSLRGVPAQEIERFFRTDGKYVEVASRYRHQVDFAYLNLAQDVFPSLSTGVWAMDIIFCRNVLIYFDAAVVQRVSRQLIAALSPDGWLFLGASDPPLHEFPECETVVTNAGLIYRRRQEAARPVAAAQAPARIEPLPVAEAPQPRQVTVARAPVAQVADEITWIARVRALANQGHVREAIAAVARALEEHRLSTELLYLRAVLEAEQGQLRTAMASCRRALYLDRDFVVAHMLMANIQNRLGLATSARRSLLNAQALLTGMAPDQVVPGADGEPAARLAEMVRLQLQFVGDVA